MCIYYVYASNCKGSETLPDLCSNKLVGHGFRPADRRLLGVTPRTLLLTTRQTAWNSYLPGFLLCPGLMKVMCRDAGGCCIYGGLCQAEELLGFGNPFYKKSSSKLLQPCSEGRNHFYFTGQEINLLSSQEGDTISQGWFGGSPSILGNSLEQKLTQEAQKHHVEFSSNTLQLKNQLK